MENICRLGEKYSSAVLPSSLKSNVKTNTKKGDKKINHRDGEGGVQKMNGMSNPVESHVVAYAHLCSGVDDSLKIMSHREDV